MTAKAKKTNIDVLYFTRDLYNNAGVVLFFCHIFFIFIFDILLFTINLKIVFRIQLNL